MFPDLCGGEFAEAVQNGADPKAVVPDEFVIDRGGSASLSPPGTPFSAATGPTLEAAAAAVPHGQVRVTTAGAIRAQGGIVEWAPEISRHGTPNPGFPDGSVVSAWRLRLLPGKPSDSNDFLLKRPSNPMGDSQNDSLRLDFDANSSWNSTARPSPATRDSSPTANSMTPSH
jgi:hypothetical protein